MRYFNKLFVIALPRCATVSISQALGLMGIKTAHLGSIYGEDNNVHYELENLKRLAEQVAQGDWDLDILRRCRGLADYPVCCLPAIRQLDRQYPGSLFVNVQRDNSIDRWLQSIEMHFVGSDLLLETPGTDDEQRQLIKTLRQFREMTFGNKTFSAQLYRAAYTKYQSEVREYFRHRNDLLQLADPESLKSTGFANLAAFLEWDMIPLFDFPESNNHSRLPKKMFIEALLAGKIKSQTGIHVDRQRKDDLDPLD
jgi:hypothetical protein